MHFPCINSHLIYFTFQMFVFSSKLFQFIISFSLFLWCFASFNTFWITKRKINTGEFCSILWSNLIRALRSSFRKWSISFFCFIWPSSFESRKLSNWVWYFSFSNCKTSFSYNKMFRKTSIRSKFYLSKSSESFFKLTDLSLSFFLARDLG